MTATNPMESVPRGMKFRVLAADLRGQIIEGSLPIGGRLPTEQELAQFHGVGINTVRRASTCWSRKAWYGGGRVRAPS